MKKSLFVLLLIATVLSACAPVAPTSTEPTFTDTAPSPTVSPVGFHVDGALLRDANGEPFLMRGINHMHTWFPDELETTIRAIAQTGSNCVRIVLTDGQQWSQADASEVAKIIRLCKQNGLIAILEVHDTTSVNSVRYLQAAAQYFIDLKEILIGEEAYVIINIANEWPTSSNLSTWKSGYLEVIPLLRAAGLNHAIMVDCFGGGQNGHCMALAGAEILQADPLKNVLFSLHIYDNVGVSAAKIEQHLRYGMDAGLCVCVGEFGNEHNGKTVDVDYLLSFCAQNELGYLAWCWKGNAGTDVMDLSRDWAGTQLSPQWGERVIDGENGIRQSSTICSVFTDNS